MDFYGINLKGDFNTLENDFFENLERTLLFLCVHSVKQSASHSPRHIVNNNSDSFFVDESLTSASYDDGQRAYKGDGKLVTKLLYNSTTPITKLVVFENSVYDNSLVDISFDDGSTWSSKHANGLIDDFTGTGPSGSEYKLRLRFNLDEAGIKAWVTTSALNTAQHSHAGCGTVSSALSFGGWTGALSNKTEKWNGSSWATTSSLNTARYYLAGCGNTGAALSFGGNSGARTDKTEKWNGTSWATTSSLNTARNGLAGCGNTGAALSFGGYTGAYANTTERWNGLDYYQYSFGVKIN